jgi:hypothetical protein
MSGEQVSKLKLRQEIAELKDFDSRQFQIFIDNFYLIKAAIRYFGVKQGLSFTSVKVSENFPLASTTAGSCLNVLEELEVVSVRKESTSASRYMPQQVDMEKLQEVENILIENFEIEEF